METIKCEMSIEDLQDINLRAKEYKECFPDFEIISKKIMIDNELVEWDGEPTDFFVVEFRMQAMNHFWTMAKDIGKIQYFKEINKKK